MADLHRISPSYDFEAVKRRRPRTFLRVTGNNAEASRLKAPSTGSSTSRSSEDSTTQLATSRDFNGRSMPDSGIGVELADGMSIASSVNEYLTRLGITSNVVMSGQHNSAMLASPYATSSIVFDPQLDPELRNEMVYAELDQLYKNHHGDSGIVNGRVEELPDRQLPPVVIKPRLLPPYRPHPDQLAARVERYRQELLLHDHNAAAAMRNERVEIDI